MKCPKCNKKMICKNSREERNVRYRLYRCVCGYLIATKESEVDVSVAKGWINAIVSTQGGNKA